VEYFNYLCNLINNVRRTREIKFSIATAKAAFNKKKTLHQQTVLKFKEETSKVLLLDHSFYGAETLALRKVDYKYLEGF
jgi:hypothetical protein